MIPFEQVRPLATIHVYTMGSMSYTREVIGAIEMATEAPARGRNSLQLKKQEEQMRKLKSEDDKLRNDPLADIEEADESMS